MSSWGWEISWFRAECHGMLEDFSASLQLGKPLIDTDLGFPPITI